MVAGQEESQLEEQVKNVFLLCSGKSIFHPDGSAQLRECLNDSLVCQTFKGYLSFRKKMDDYQCEWNVTLLHEGSRLC